MSKRHLIGAVVVALACASCGSKPTAMVTCKKLEESGVATACKEDKPGGIGAAAIEKVAFDLPAVPGKTGQVLRFDDVAGYEATEKAFGAAAMLAGPHRYGNEKALIFVQLNSDTPQDVGAKAKAAVDAL